MGNTKNTAAGTLEVKTFKATKTGRKFRYEIYTTAAGDLKVARLVEYFAGVVTEPVWGDVCDNEAEAVKSAFHAYATPARIAQGKREAEYYRSGGY